MNHCWTLSASGIGTCVKCGKTAGWNEEEKCYQMPFGECTGGTETESPTYADMLIDHLRQLQDRLYYDRKVDISDECDCLIMTPDILAQLPKATGFNRDLWFCGLQVHVYPTVAECYVRERQLRENGRRPIVIVASQDNDQTR